jgi:sulfite reductase (ferredoxin)
VFEVIAEDLAVAVKALAQAAQDGDDGDSLFRGLLATVRALLITRGVDSQQPDEILRAFEKHFVDAVYVDTGFRGLLARARGYYEGWREALVGRREETGRLLARVELLYSTMDADLKFHAPEAGAAPAAVTPEAAAATAEMDLRGVACPMNFVKAKLRLETLETGATLGLLLDDGAPVQNVPTSFRNEGQEIVETRDIGGGHWHVVVKKRR